MAGPSTPQHPPGQQPIQSLDAILDAAQQSFDQAIEDAGFTPDKPPRHLHLIRGGKS